jgi:AcrR family transcriptional regulator
MTRLYRMTRRAEQQAETRRRIVEAAVELHGSVGPARTSTSMVARRAGVQRDTRYAHFPDDRRRNLACSGLAAERDPLPDAAPWREIAERRARLRAGLQAVYDWYGRNERLAACVLRDGEHHALTREVVELRIEPQMRAWREVLGATLSTSQQALLRSLLSFHSWRSLVRESGLAPGAAVAAAVGAILGAE